MQDGFENEKRFFLLLSRFLEVLKANSLVFDGICRQSGRHCPRAGLRDWQDRDGEDVFVRLSVHPPGQLLTCGSLIYDVKSSSRAAKDFNAKIQRRVGQKKALLKKALVVNEGRSDEEIIAEVLDDFISVGLLASSIKQRAIDLLSARAS